MNEEQSEEIEWYKNLNVKENRKLPYMFCFVGEKINFPNEAKDENGIPFVPPIIVLSDTQSPTCSFGYW